MTKRKRDREKASRQQESEALKTKEKMGEREHYLVQGQRRTESERVGEKGKKKV